jgi:hypothetical protein
MEEAVETSLIRKRVETLPKKIKNIRNNVEAAIFQFGYHYRTDKSRYRGLGVCCASRIKWYKYS